MSEIIVGAPSFRQRNPWWFLIRTCQVSIKEVPSPPQVSIEIELTNKNSSASVYLDWAVTCYCIFLFSISYSLFLFQQMYSLTYLLLCKIGFKPCLSSDISYVDVDMSLQNITFQKLQKHFLHPPIVFVLFYSNLLHGFTCTFHEGSTCTGTA